MKTPQGIECPYFFGDYYRGRDREECRLVSDGPTGKDWTTKLCANCPVPSIIRANACRNMILSGRVERTLFGLSRRIAVAAFCSKSNSTVKEPEIGCGLCHPLDDLYKGNDK